MWFCHMYTGVCLLCMYVFVQVCMCVRNRNLKLKISTAPTKAKSWEPAHSHALTQNKIDRQQVRSRELGRECCASARACVCVCVRMCVRVCLLAIFDVPSNFSNCSWRRGSYGSIIGEHDRQKERAESTRDVGDEIDWISCL